MGHPTKPSSPALTGAAFLDHRRSEKHGGLMLAQISGQGRAIQPAQRLQAQAGLQAIGREPDRQAVPPAADRLRKVLAGVS